MSLYLSDHRPSACYTYPQFLCQNPSFILFFHPLVCMSSVFHHSAYCPSNRCHFITYSFTHHQTTLHLACLPSVFSLHPLSLHLSVQVSSIRRSSVRYYSFPPIRHSSVCCSTFCFFSIRSPFVVLSSSISLHSARCHSI